MKDLLEIYKDIKELNRKGIAVILGILLVFDMLLSNNDLKIGTYCMLTAMLIAYMCFVIKIITEKLDMQIRRTHSCEKVEKTKKDLEITAFHEAGHAIVARISNPKATIQMVTIEGSKEGNYAGFVKREFKRTILQKTDRLSEIRICFGGMVGELIAYGQSSYGSRDDLRKAKNIATDMIYLDGMGEQIIYAREDNKVIEEANIILKNEKANAIKILQDNKELLYSLKDLLLHKKTLNQTEMDTFFKEYGI